MAAQLGTTTDPRALIPGDPDAVLDSASALLAHATGMEDTGNGLRGVDPGGWSGPTSNAFQDRLSSQPPEWFTIGDALAAAAETMNGYSDTLRWAQTQAREAIELWERGEAKSTAAAPTSVAAVVGLPGSGGVADDPGGGLRAEAEELLARARRQLAEAGDSAAASIGGNGDAGKKPGVFSRFLDWFSDDSGTDYIVTQDGDVITRSWWRRGPSADWDAKGPNGTFSSKDGFSLGELTGNAYLVRGGSGRFPGDHWGGAWDEWAIGAEGKATGNIGLHGLDLNAGARVGGWGEANGVLGSIGDTPIGGKLSTFVGGEATANGHIGEDGAYGKAGAFAGGKAGLEVGNVEEVAGIQVKGTAEGWVGPGAEAEGGVYRDDDGRIHIGGKGGASPIIGGKLGGEVIVDPGEFSETARDAVDRYLPGRDDDNGNDNGPREA